MHIFRLQQSNNKTCFFASIISLSLAYMRQNEEKQSSITNIIASIITLYKAKKRYKN